MDLPFYQINDKIYPRVTLILDVLNPGFGLMKYKITKALEAYKEICSYHFDKTIDINSDIEIKRSGEPRAEKIKLLDRVLELSKREVEEAANHGTLVHEMLEEHVANKGILDDSLESQGFLAWQKEHKPKFLETEQVLFHPDLCYAGTCDLICKIGKETWIVDYKTSNKLYPKNGLQLTSYAMAKEKISNVKIDKIGCLQLGKNKKGFYFKEYPRQDDIVEILVKLFSWMNPNFVKNQEKAIKEKFADSPKLVNHKIKL